MAAGMLLLLIASTAAAARNVTYDTSEVTEAAVALAPDGSALVFTMVGHLFRLPLAPVDEKGPAIAEQLTFGPYYDGEPAFSPDGAKLAFVSDRAAADGDELGIFVLELATKKITQLTHEPFAIRPTFTAAGDAIAYLSVPGKPAYPGSLIVRRIPASGGEATTLRATPDQYRSIFRTADGRIAWSIAAFKPGSDTSSRIETLGDDGTPVVLATCDGVLERVEAAPGGEGVFARRTQGRSSFGGVQTEDLVFVATGKAPGTVRSIAPLDSKQGPRPRIAVASPSTVFLGDAGRLVKIDAETGARAALPISAHVELSIDDPVRPTGPAATAPRVIVNPLLASDGSLIFEAYGHLFSQPAGGTARRIEDRATGSHAFESGAALSRDGKKLAFTRSEGMTMDLAVLDLRTGDVTTIASGAGYSEPAWSADGSRLVFVESAGFAASIVSTGADGTSRTELGEAGFWSARPNLSADGKWLFTTANVTGVGNVYKQEVAGAPGTAPVAVTSLTRHASDGIVSPDGKRLAFRRNKEIWIAPLGGTDKALGDSDVRRFAEEGGDGYSFAPDSKALVYAAGGRVYKQPVGTGARVEIPIHLDAPVAKIDPLLLRNVRVLDFGTKGFTPPTSLLIDGGRIAWVGPERGRAIPSRAAILDASGKFAIPGLFEMHAHAGGANPEAFIAYGITTVRDTGGSLAGTSEIVDRAEATDEAIPRYVFSGEIFEGEHPYWGDGFLQIQSEAEARAYVRRFKAGGASFIKVYPSLPWPLQLATIDEARKAGLPVVGHGMSVNEITRSVTHGFSSIEHTVFPVRIYDDVIRMLAASETRWDPTLAVVGGDSQLLRKEPGRLSDPKFLALTPPSTIEFASGAGYEKDYSDSQLSSAWAGQLASLKDAHARGVKLAIGTDAPNPGCFYGASLHWEMEFFAEAGIPTIEVLRLATLGAAQTLGAADLGVIAPGKLADLVLLDANPLENIKNTQSIWRTVKGGRVFDPNDGK
jgi:imidazolonepropionase-like amidohydrolase/Tol biopolymer transport system component